MWSWSVNFLPSRRKQFLKIFLFFSRSSFSPDQIALILDSIFVLSLTSNFSLFLKSICGSSNKLRFGILGALDHTRTLLDGSSCEITTHSFERSLLTSNTLWKTQSLIWLVLVSIRNVFQLVELFRTQDLHKSVYTTEFWLLLSTRILETLIDLWCWKIIILENLLYQWFLHRNYVRIWFIMETWHKDLWRWTYRFQFPNFTNKFLNWNSFLRIYNKNFPIKFLNLIRGSLWSNHLSSNYLFVKLINILMKERKTTFYHCIEDNSQRPNISRKWIIRVSLNYLRSWVTWGATTAFKFFQLLTVKVWESKISKFDNTTTSK